MKHLLLIFRAVSEQLVSEHIGCLERRLELLCDALIRNGQVKLGFLTSEFTGELRHVLHVHQTTDLVVEKDVKDSDLHHLLFFDVGRILRSVSVWVRRVNNCEGLIVASATRRSILLRRLLVGSILLHRVVDRGLFYDLGQTLS